MIHAKSASGLANKNVVVIGGSGGWGRAIVDEARDKGARVLAVARTAEPLARLVAERPGTMTLPLDATDKSAPERVVEALVPDILILSGGAIPTIGRLHEQTWEQFERNWQTDVRTSFLFCSAALRRPLRPGALVITISSGAAIGGSHLSGGYAGAKRMQMFLADYAQEVSDREGLGLRFASLAPAVMMPETELGTAAVAAYSTYQGMTPAAFVEARHFNLTPADVSRSVIDFVQSGDTGTYTISAAGLNPVP